MRAALLAIGALVAAGCATTVRVPRVEPHRAETVYLIDYGRHSSLVLPPRGPVIPVPHDAVPLLVSYGVLEAEESLAGHAVEYAYGEWKWFALNENRWHDLLRTMVLPTQGTLGRRDMGTAASAESLAWQVVCEEYHPIEVDRALLNDLRDRLDDRFASHRESQTFNSLYSMHFVHDESLYSLAHNCNQVVAQWLRELGCDVRGVSVDANYKIVREIVD